MGNPFPCIFKEDYASHDVPMDVLKLCLCLGRIKSSIPAR